MQMKPRLFGSLSTAALLAALLTVPAFAQAPAANTKAAPTATKASAAGAIPRTADGHPDLSGVYSNVTTVPMTRPANCADKEFYTPEDIANGLGGARGCGGNAAGGRGAGGGRGGAGGARGAAANIDPETGQPALAVHYD